MMDWDKDLEKMIIEEEEKVDSFFEFEFDSLFEEKNDGKKKVGRPKKKESIDVDKTMNFLDEAVERLG